MIRQTFEGIDDGNEGDDEWDTSSELQEILLPIQLLLYRHNH